MTTTWPETGAAGHAHTERLCLRAPETTDARAHHELHSDPATNAHNPAGPSADPAANAAELDLWRASWTVDGLGYWMVRENCEGEVIGVGGVRRAFLDDPVLNLYYRFRPTSWGRGYAVELALAAIEAARALIPGTPVVALIRPGNHASRKVAERAGLVFDRLVDRHDAPSEVYVLPPGVSP
ncbi:GNAT family N-acetyltransferase [Phytomonospora endophytica]|uniref:RimJ/RimL family protein N-acetyltransferase n=1 Tax=Phytomonospora endophytica TaxID=714109 RepID=A0A841FI49_9ACTN|nr:GNAT family N-acetyltransferase [Phytomonospora endophytica]MBB6033518.1 RimJ/RimL family protein N-acetyltransferase [Phytomonospora endophytica]GIG64965.1 GNAT family acetyltransferase [Phytomonospora endophytica]